MSDQRGFTIVEMLVTCLLAGIIFLGLGSMYVMTSKSLAESNSQAALQRQGTLAMDEIARRVRSATSIAPATSCNGVAIANSVSLAMPSGATPPGPFCYYAGSNGRLCEYVGTGSKCRNLLAEGLKPVYLMTQTNPPDPRCPSGVAAGRPCLAIAAPGGTSATVSFTIQDAQFGGGGGDDDDDGGSPTCATTGRCNVMSFSSTVSCSGRNC